MALYCKECKLLLKTLYFRRLNLPVKLDDYFYCNNCNLVYNYKLKLVIKKLNKNNEVN